MAEIISIFPTSPQNQERTLTNSNQKIKFYHVFTPIIMIYTSFSMASTVLALKIITFHGLLITGAAVCLPFRYLLGDIIAEVYGYRIAQWAIFCLLSCGLFFCIFITEISKLPSPAFWTHQAAYDFILGSTIHISLYAGLGVLIGGTLNVYIVSKAKILTGEKLFWLRCFTASAAGELTQYFIGLTLIYWNKISIEKILYLIFSDYLTQLIFIILLTPFAQIIMLLIKHSESKLIRVSEIVAQN